MAGVALGTMLFVALTALATGFQQAARAPLAAVAADMVVTRPSGAEESSPGAQRGRGVRMPFGLAGMTTREADGVAEIEGVAETASALQLWDFGSRDTTTIVGVDPAATAVGPGRALAGELVSGRTFRLGERQVAVLDLHYARFYDLEVGSSVRVGDRSFQTVGIVELTQTSQAAAANLYVPLPEAQALAGLGGGDINQIYLRVGSASDVDAVVERVTKRLGRVSAMTEDSLVQVMGGIGRVSSRFARVAGAVALAGGLLLGWFALQGLVAERRREIGVMKAVGWRGRDVARVFLREALLLSILGGLVGLSLGLGAATLLSRLPVPEPSLAPGQHELPGGHATEGARDQPLPARVGPGAAVAAVVTVSAAGTLAGWSTARRAAALKPAPVLQSL
ncbi:MAG: ABC transporter permease [Actinomycetota bacterium]|nr:ABC transporter permease [Actinomycetota bacterium]